MNSKGSGMRYTTGDHVAIYPKNPSSVVDAIGERCRVDLDQVGRRVVHWFFYKTLYSRCRVPIVRCVPYAMCARQYVQNVYG